ncbi:acyl-CoA dehydrogenase family protein [Actinomadura welshii]|uniref:acyl-CoA dehydrogenase family protein n=1 Tax=Actinomadura welshii TaxID=3103817 RepID=UPI003B8A5C86
MRATVREPAEAKIAPFPAEADGESRFRREALEALEALEAGGLHAGVPESYGAWEPTRRPR